MIEKFKKFRKKLKENSNKGFTLVELLISIAILSLVVFPVFEVFVTATKTNSKSRTELQATLTANSVLESSKAFSIRVFHEQCAANYNTVSKSKFTLVAGEQSGGTVKSLLDAGGTAGILKLGDDGKYKLVQNSGEAFTADSLSVKSVYMYGVNGIKQSHNYYDAVVVFSECEYQDTEMTGANGNSVNYKESDSNGNYSDYNKKFDITVYVYKHQDTPVYVGATDLNENALLKITGNKLDNAQ